MFDPKMADDTDNDILKEIIQMCETHMGGGLKKPDEDPIEGILEGESEVPTEEPSEISADKSDIEGADLEELMEMYKNIKG